MATKFVNKKLMKRDQVTHELGILQSLQHPLLVGLLDTFETPTSYVLVLEMCVHTWPSAPSSLPPPRGFVVAVCSLRGIDIGLLEFTELKNIFTAIAHSFRAFQ